MQNFTRKIWEAICILLIAVVCFQASAVSLSIDADLVIHPKQMQSFFDMESKNIAASSEWVWPQLEFLKPFKTAWSHVSAVGPFTLKLNASEMGARRLGVEMYWRDPVLTASQFEIHDTIVKDVGGHTVVIHLDGICNNLSVKLPGGNWTAKGHMIWDHDGGGFFVDWDDFDFQSGLSAPAIDLGKCNAPAGIQEALRDAITQSVSDKAWVVDALKQGILRWTAQQLAGVQDQLLAPRTIAIRKGLALEWKPDGIQRLGEGILYVPGKVELNKPEAGGESSAVVRGYDINLLKESTGSAFYMPKETLTRLTGFLFRIGELQYLAPSTAIPQFVELMHNRRNKYLVWPDLNLFSPEQLFMFDLTSRKAPLLTQPQELSSGGIAYNVSAPLVLSQGARFREDFIPYVDFSSPVQGRLYATIKDSQLNFRLYPEDIALSSVFRPEYQQIRLVNKRMDEQILGDKMTGFLRSTPLKVNFPVWKMGEELVIEPTDLRFTGRSFRIPLDLKKSK